jgi:geranylgeranyl diphosphate synthase type I
MHQDIVDFQTELNSQLDSFLQEEFLSYQKISNHPEVGGILEHIQSVSRGGKRVRPYLVWSLYTANRPNAALTDIAPLLLAVELFHIFCLIHDDVMDEAMVRHGVPTIQQFAKTSFYQSHTTSATKISDNQAILAGDIVFNSVFKLLNRFSATNPTDAPSIITTFHTLIDEVCIGQMIDVHLTAQTTVTDEALAEKNKLKTAYYSFARPLHLGVIVSGREELLPFALAFGEKMGTLYQIQDDLLDITGNAHNTKKPLFQDVVQNQHTLLSNFVRSTDQESAQLLDSFCGKTLSESDTTVLKDLFTTSGAIAYTEQIIETTISEITDLMETYELNDVDRSLFSNILSLIIKRTS